MFRKSSALIKKRSSLCVQTQIRVHITHESYVVNTFGHSLLSDDLLSFQPPKQPKKINEHVMITN